MGDTSWPSPLNVWALLSVPDKTAFFLAALYFCSPKSRTLLKVSISNKPPPPPRQGINDDVLFFFTSCGCFNYQSREGGAFEVFCSLFFILLLIQGQLFSNARVVSSLVLWSVTIRALNSVASHLFMICKNWHVPKSLYVIRLVYRLGRGVPGRNFIYESQIKQHPVPLKLHTPHPLNLYGSSDLHMIELVTVVRTVQTCWRLCVLTGLLLCHGHQKHPLALNLPSCTLVVSQYVPAIADCQLPISSLSTWHFRTSFLTVRKCSKLSST